MIYFLKTVTMFLFVVNVYKYKYLKSEFLPGITLLNSNRESGRDGLEVEEGKGWVVSPDPKSSKLLDRNISIVPAIVLL